MTNYQPLGPCLGTGHCLFDLGDQFVTVLDIWADDQPLPAMGLPVEPAQERVSNRFRRIAPAIDDDRFISNRG